MIKIEGWKYYNHAAIPVCEPHEQIDLCPIEDNSIWCIGGADSVISTMDNRV